MRTRVSLIETVILGGVESIGALISAGAMVNERDEAGHTLLHLIAMGDRVANGYQVALELLRHGGPRGIDWDAVTNDGKTALVIAEENLQNDLGDDMRTEMTAIAEFLRYRHLPFGEQYVFPCMGPSYCQDCGSSRCSSPENDVPGMPGSYC